MLGSRQRAIRQATTQVKVILLAAFLLTAVLLMTAQLTGCMSLPPAAGDADAPDWNQRDDQTLIIIAVDNSEQRALTSPGSTLRGYDGASHYAVSSQARMTLTNVANDFGLQELSAWPIPSLRLHCAVFAVLGQQDATGVMRALQADTRVRLVEPMQHYKTLSIDYNDPYLSLQRGFTAVHAAAAHEHSRGQGVRIAVIDSGVDASHPDLRGQIIAQRQFTGAQSTAESSTQHGTEVAGIIAALGNNREGIVGIAPAAKLLSLQACWGVSVSGAAATDHAQCNSFTLAQALSAAIDAEADIVNLSLAGPADPLLTRLVEQGMKQGQIFVAALPIDGQLHGFPAGILGVITATPNSAQVKAESTLPAPGRDILTLTPGGHYDFVSGSSMAAAHVTGAIALLLAKQHKLNAATALQLLRDSRSQQPDGPVDACAALATLQQSSPCERAEIQAAVTPISASTANEKSTASEATVLSGRPTH